MDIEKCPEPSSQMIELETKDEDFLVNLQKFMQTQTAMSMIHPFFKKAYVIFSTVFDIQNTAYKSRLSKLDDLSDPSMELTQLLK